MPALLLALASVTAAERAHADPPPPLRCRAEGPARTLEFGATGTLTRLAVAQDGERIVVAARFVPRSARGTTRVLAGEISRDGQWALPPRVVLSARGRFDGAVELVVHGRARAVVASMGRRAQVAQLRADDEPSLVMDVPAPSRLMRVDPLVVTRGREGFALVWRSAGGVQVQSYAVQGEAREAASRSARGDAREDVPAAIAHVLEERAELAPVRPLVPRLRVVAGASRVARLPIHTMVVSAADSGASTVGMVVRTAGRRYVLAVMDASGRVQWPQSAPAGCDRGRCPSVELLPAPGGFVASWQNRRTPDGLYPPGARALDPRGHTRWRAPTFIPMARGIAIAGPQGQALALQTGHPIVMRGGERPIAWPAPETPLASLPVVARAWVIDALGPGLGGAWATRDGVLAVGALRCAPPAGAREP